MSEMFTESVNQSTYLDMLKHFEQTESAFEPPLSQTVNLKEYSRKLFSSAERIEVWEGHTLVALVAVYLNKDQGFGFITNVSLLSNYHGSGLGKSILKRCEELVKLNRLREIRLEVHKENVRAKRFYEKSNFALFEEKKDTQILVKSLN